MLILTSNTYLCNVLIFCKNIRYTEKVKLIFIYFYKNVFYRFNNGICKVVNLLKIVIKSLLFSESILLLQPEAQLSIFVPSLRGSQKVCLTIINSIHQ